MPKKPIHKELEREIESLKREISGLKKSETDYKTIFKYSPVAILSVDTDGNILELNDRLLDWLGYKREELLGRNFRDLEFLTEKSKIKIMENFMLRLKGERVIPYNADVIIKSGEKRVGQVVAELIKDEKGNIIKDLVMISDVTESHKEQIIFLESLKKSRAFFEAIPDLVFVIKRSGTIVDFKADLGSNLAIPREEIIGKTIADIGLNNQNYKTVMKNIKKTIRDERVQTFEYDLLTPEGIGNFECRMSSLNNEEVLAVVRNITKHKQFEDELRLKNEVFETSLAANSTADVFGNINYVNRSFLSFWGYKKKEDVLGRPVSDFFLNKEEAQPVMESLYETGKWSGVYTAKKRDGNTFIAHGFATIVNDNSGNIIGFQSTVLDISESKRSEEALRSSESKYRALFEDNNDAVFLFSLDGVHLEANQRAAELLDYPLEEIVGKPISNFTETKESKDSLKKIKLLMKGEKLPIYERTFIKKDGTKFPAEVNISLISDSEGNPIHFQSIVRDITKKKQAALDIEKRQKYIDSFLNSVPEAIVTLDSSHKIVEWNPGAERVFGYNQEEVKGRNIDDFIVKPEMMEEAEGFTKKVLSGDLVYPKETIRYRKDGTPVNVIVSGSPIKIRGKLQGIVAIYIDISMQKKIEKELNKADKLESIALLAGGIAHDFNNILASISVNTGLLDIYRNDEQKMKSKVKEIESAILRAKGLTQQLLTFSRGNTPIKNPASINKFLEETINFALSGSKVKCECCIPDELWQTDIDVSQINQVFQNIVINAVQAMPEGGTIIVKAENIDGKEIKDLPLKGNKYIRIEFKDYGIGIVKNHLENIFDPFFTTKQQGGGLGLATAFSIVKNHEGIITAESELGVSTSFFVYLPALNNTLKSKETDDDEIIPGNGNILLMDDDEMILNATGGLLEHIGYTVVSAKEGKEAIKLFKKKANTPDGFDCVILDLTIPNGLGGKETVLELKKIDADVKAIASSGYSVDPIIENCENFGFSGAIAKPYVISDLSKLLKNIISDKK